MRTSDLCKSWVRTTWSKRGPESKALRVANCNRTNEDIKSLKRAPLSLLNTQGNGHATAQGGLSLYSRVTATPWKITVLVSQGCCNKLSQTVWLKTTEKGASLVAQWLRICLPMQGTRVRALVWEDPTCRGATRPVSHNY